MIREGLKAFPFFFGSLQTCKKTPRGAHLTLIKYIMDYLSQNFTMQEAVCKCGCRQHKMYMIHIVRQAVRLQALRDYIEQPIHVNSWFRCPTHNKKVGGVSGSQHLIGAATDIWVRGMSISQLKWNITNAYVAGVIPKPTMITYPSFVHLDFRG